jgi:hypothetical protein
MQNAMQSRYLNVLIRKHAQKAAENNRKKVFR